MKSLSCSMNDLASSSWDNFFFKGRHSILSQLRCYRLQDHGCLTKLLIVTQYLLRSGGCVKALWNAVFVEGTN